MREEIKRQEQCELDVRTDLEHELYARINELAHTTANSVSNSECRSTYEAYGIMAGRYASMTEASKKLKKTMESLIEVIEGGAETPARIASICGEAITLAVRSVVLSGYGIVCMKELNDEK